MTIIILYHVEEKKKLCTNEKKNLHTYNIIIQLTY